MMFIMVDFPDPDGPMTDSISPLSTERLTPRRASTLTRPIWYVFVTSRMAMTGMYCCTSATSTGPRPVYVVLRQRPLPGPQPVYGP